MGKMDTRLEKVEGALNARQFVYQLIDRCKQYKSLDECTLRFSAGDWKKFEKNSTEKVYASIKARMKQEKKTDEAIYRACNRAGNEMTFLYSLFTRTTSHFVTDVYRHSYNRLKLDNLLLILHFVIEKPPEEKAEELESVLRYWKHRATRHLYHLYQEKLTAEAIGNRYFEGRDLLFEEDRAKLEAFIKSAEEHIGKVNDVIYMLEDTAPHAVDKEAVMQDVRQHLDEFLEYEADMAKVEVFNNSGKTEKGFAILGGYAEQELA